MIEILILIALYRNMSAKAEAKGRSGGGYGCMVVVFWIGGEVLGAVAASILSSARNGGGEPNMLFVYGGGTNRSDHRGGDRVPDREQPGSGVAVRPVRR